MYNYLRKYAFFKNTYGKSFLVRIEFEVEVPKNCLLLADNICQCDSWFAKDNDVRLKYDIIFSGDKGMRSSVVVKKSIIVDLTKPLSSAGIVELIISNNAGLTDTVSEGIANLKVDSIKSPVY